MKDPMTPQELQLELITQASFNNFNGLKIAWDLEAHQDLWEAVIMDRASTFKPIDLIKLRDLPKHFWNADTLFMIPKAGKRAELLALVSTWNPDELDYLPTNEAKLALGGSSSDVLRAWWD